MAYRIKKDLGVTASIQRVAISQIQKAAADMDQFDEDPAGSVHEARKRFKKIRGLIRLVRPSLGTTYKKENHWFRDQARRIATVRDAAAFVETIDRLEEHLQSDKQKQAQKQIRSLLVEHHKQAIENDQLAEIVWDIRNRMDEAIGRVKQWKLKEDGFDAIGPGLGKTYHRACKEMAKSYEKKTEHRFHQWRKRVKYHRYHCKLLRELWEPMIMQRRDETKRLTDLLGWDHDLAELRNHLTNMGSDKFEQADRNEIIELSHMISLRHRNAARRLGRKLFAESQEQFVGRMGKIYTAWTSRD